MTRPDGTSIVGPETIAARQNESFAGGVLHALAVRTDQGWRLSELSMRNTWRTGTGYAAMLATPR